MSYKVKLRFAASIGVSMLVGTAIAYGQTAPAHANLATLTIQTDKPVGKVSPTLYGLMTEEINYSYEGGLYAEMVSNRNFIGSWSGVDQWVLTPFGNANEKAEAMREAVNAFIRTPGSFDAVVDFDQVIRDPADPRQFRAGFNNFDKLHPNDAGYKAMADAVDLSLFASTPAPKHKKK